MDEIRTKKEKKTEETRSFCREIGDHVHYPPTRLSRSTRPILSTGSASYGECRKNQAAGTGNIAYDGCGEFVSATAGEDCAACGCHRSFHREESISNATSSVTEAVLEALKRSSYQLRHIFCSPYGEGKKEPSRREDRCDLMEEEEEEEEAAVGGAKRLKTKFTAEQTEKMRNYAEKLRWKVSHDRREEVDQFCVAIGVKREKFRIWMNNHKEKNDKLAIPLSFIRKKHRTSGRKARRCWDRFGQS